MDVGHVRVTDVVLGQAGFGAQWDVGYGRTLGPVTTDLDGDAATEQLAALHLPGTYAIRLAAQRRLMLVLAEEIAATEPCSPRLRSSVRGGSGHDD